MLTVLFSLRDCFRARAVLQAEILALRLQLLVLQRSSRGRRLRLRWADRSVGLTVSCGSGFRDCGTDWRSALLLVKPETVIAWHRQGFRLYWNWKIRHLEGRPCVSPEVRNLIRKMSLANPRWGAPPHSRRIVEDWNRGVASHGRQVLGPASEAALPDMANLSQESRQGLGFCRLLRCPHDYIPTPIRLCDSRP